MDYTYKILRSSLEFNVMNVEYSAVDCESIVVGMPLPVEGQNHLDIIRAYAPIHHWERAKQVVVEVTVGEVGTLTTTVLPPTVTSTPQPQLGDASSGLTTDQITQTSTTPAT